MPKLSAKMQDLLEDLEQEIEHEEELLEQEEGELEEEEYEEETEDEVMEDDAEDKEELDETQQEEDEMVEAQHEEDFEEEFEEEFEDEEYEYTERSKIIPYAVMGAALFAFISLGWYAYNTGADAVSDDELILIQAEQTPIKERPLDSGGMQFPYQDKSVFETITADSSASTRATVVSNAEEPMTIEPATSTIENTNIAQAEKPTEMVATTGTKIKETVKAAAPKAEMVKEVKPVAKIVPKATPKAAPVSSASTAGGSTVQLGAFRSDADARASWSKIKSTHSVLSGYSPKFIRADLGEKGVFYRLRVGGVDATSMCGALKTAGQPCMKVK